MVKFHFIEDYERIVRDLLDSHPLDEAMSLAVGGDYEQMGDIQIDVLLKNGLHDGMSIVDLGCGSGRTAKKIGQRLLNVSYLGVDVVQPLLDYAALQSPSHFKFVRHTLLNVPANDQSADMIIAFSLFTHLLHEETYLYLEDARRVLRPGATLVFSFLEFAKGHHWDIFRHTVTAKRNGTPQHLNMFIERGVIEIWAKSLGFEVVRFVDDSLLGQSLCVLQNPH